MHNQEPDLTPSGLSYENRLARDEAFRGSTQLFDHWQSMLLSLQSLGSQALDDRLKTITRILRDDGAIYNAAAGTADWALDPVPMLITPDEWQWLEQGLAERAQLLDFVLKDIYGQQEIIRSGLVPPEVVYSHPGFLRSCYHMRLPGAQQLIFYASDLVRGEDNQWAVVGDRTQAPSGSGYALENRIVMQRVFPLMFRDSNAKRLRQFFNVLRQQLLSLAPYENLQNGEAPRMVILTPGAYSETFFEHAFLSNYLGYPLVQGKDLTVRKGNVWMKTLDGLSRVDVILRRVDDSYCDPVELRGDSQLGVPGLLEVARAGRVSVVNPIGSGILESGALMKYLPAISERFFGKTPRLPNAATYWCGDASDMNYVLDNLAELRIKEAHHQFDSRSIYGHRLTQHQLAELRQKILDDPNKFVAQQHISPSQAPCWRSGEMQPRAVTLRTFAVASDDHYQVMPGGLTRAAAEQEDHYISNQLGAVSKDTWVLGGEHEAASVLANAGSAPSRSIDTSLPSRVAENLFWVGRYAERADATLRLLRTVFMQINGSQEISAQAERMLLYAVTHLTMTYPGFTETGTDPVKQSKSDLLDVILDGNRSGTVMSSLNAMLVSAAEVREMLSSDTQRVMNDIQDELGRLAGKLKWALSSAPEEALDSLVTTLLALAGLFQESMFRGRSWHFLQLGRRIEKTYQLATLMRSLLVSKGDEETSWACTDAILLTSEALNTFRRRFRNDSSLYNVLTTLVLDRSNPRSLLYQLEHIQAYLQNLPGNSPNAAQISFEQRQVIEAISLIKLADLDAMVKVDDSLGIRPQLDQVLVRVQELMNQLAMAISDRYFDHTAGPQQLIERNSNND